MQNQLENPLNDNSDNEIGKIPKDKPWDARLAFLIILPFKNTPISPNFFTTLRLLVGLVSAWYFAGGQVFNLAAILFALSHLLDHTDGELARLTGKTSRFGHYYDLASDALIMILLFICSGIGLSISLQNATSPFLSFVQQWGILMGVLAGFSVAIIFQLRNIIENKLGKTATQQARFRGVEIEDILYLLPLVTLSGGLPIFLVTAAIGAPVGAILVFQQYKNSDV